MKAPLCAAFISIAMFAQVNASERSSIVDEKDKKVYSAQILDHQRTLSKIPRAALKLELAKSVPVNHQEISELKPLSESWGILTSTKKPKLSNGSDGTPKVKASATVGSREIQYSNVSINPLSESWNLLDDKPLKI